MNCQPLLIGASLLWIASHVAAAENVPAFPGIEGAGADTTGGRGGRVVHVTNLKPDGPGSLQEAVKGGNCIVVFDVSGIIDLSRSKKGEQGKGGKISISEPNVTIAGQTAPGDGICLKGGMLQIAADNVIVRYLRSRRGWVRESDSGDAIEAKGNSIGELATGNGQTQAAFDKRKLKKESRGKYIHEFAGMSHVVIDHCSASWATDENLTCTHVDRSTISWSIAAEGCDYTNPKQTPPNHSEGSLWGSGTADGRSTMHHMLYAHNRLRNPRTTGGTDQPPTLTFYNNVVYDWSEYASHTGSERVFLNWMNNYYKPGLDTGNDIRGQAFGFHGDPQVRLYGAGNFIEENAAATRDNKLAVYWDEHKFNKAGPADRAVMLVGRPFGDSLPKMQSAQEAYESVLDGSGATLPARDAVDLRIVSQVRDGKGKIIQKETDFPDDQRWPEYRSLPPLPDADGDGIPDEWEKQFGLNPNEAADSAKVSHGYANIEHYFNNTDPTGKGATLVFVSAAVNRASVKDRKPGEWRISRAGDTSAPLKVGYRVIIEGAPDANGRDGEVIIPAGRSVASVPFDPPASMIEGRNAILSLKPAERSVVGCPARSLIVAVH